MAAARGMLAVTAILLAAVVVAVLLGGAVQITAIAQDSLEPNRPDPLGSIRVALNAVAILILLGAFGALLIAARRGDSAYAGGLVLSAIATPFLAAILTIAAYLWRGDLSGQINETESYRALLIGLGVTLVAWLLAAYALRSFVSVDRANTSLYLALTERRDRLAASVEAWCPPCSCHPTRHGTLAREGDVETVGGSTPRAPGESGRLGALLLLVPLAVVALVDLFRARTSSVPGGSGVSAPVSPAGSSGESLRGSQRPPEDPSVPACSIAHRHLCELEAQLGRSGGRRSENGAERRSENGVERRAGTQWVTGSGYVGLWARVHRAEEALIAIAPRHQLIRWAIDDDLRLQGASVPNGKVLQDKLRLAMRQLAADAYISAGADTNAAAVDGTLQTLAAEVDTNTTIPAPVRGAVKESLDQASSTARASANVAREVILNADGQGGGGSSAEDARAALAEVRHELNSYRHGIWSQMVEERNRLKKQSEEWKAQLTSTEPVGGATNVT